jgi:hypothetical protein
VVVFDKFANFNDGGHGVIFDRGIRNSVCGMNVTIIPRHALTEETLIYF